MKIPAAGIIYASQPGTILIPTREAPEWTKLSLMNSPLGPEVDTQRTSQRRIRRVGIVPVLTPRVPFNRPRAHRHRRRLLNRRGPAPFGPLDRPGHLVSIVCDLVDLSLPYTSARNSFPSLGTLVSDVVGKGGQEQGHAVSNDRRPHEASRPG